MLASCSQFFRAALFDFVFWLCAGEKKATPTSEREAFTLMNKLLLLPEIDIPGFIKISIMFPDSGCACKKNEQLKRHRMMTQILFSVVTRRFDVFLLNIALMRSTSLMTWEGIVFFLLCFSVLCCLSQSRCLTFSAT